MKFGAVHKIIKMLAIEQKINYAIYRRIRWITMTLLMYVNYIVRYVYIHYT